MADEGGLHFRRVDVLATCLDHVFLAVHDVEEPSFVKAAHVAGVHPAATQDLAIDVVALPVAEHAGGSPGDDLAGSANGHVVVLIVDYARLNAGCGFAGGDDRIKRSLGPLTAMVFRFEHGDDRAHFRHPVGLDEVAVRQQVHGAFEQRQGHGRGAIQDRAEVGKIIVLHSWMIDQKVDHGRHERDRGDLANGDFLQAGLGVEGFDERVGGAAHDAEIQAGDVGQMEHRRGVQVDFARGEIREQHGHCIRVEIAVAEHGGFGSASGAGGVEETGEVVGLGLVDVFEFQGFGRSGAVVDHAFRCGTVACVDDGFQRGALLLDVGGQRGEALVNDQEGTAGIVE